jgi:hypothetical protein
MAEAVMHGATEISLLECVANIGQRSAGSPAYICIDFDEPSILDGSISFSGSAEVIAPRGEILLG